MTRTVRSPPRFPALRSLRARVVGLIALFLLAFCGIGVVVVDRAESAVVAVERPRLQAQTTTLADTISYAVLAHSTALLAAPIAAFAQNADLKSVRVSDDRGAVLIASGADDGVDNDEFIDIDADVFTKGTAPGGDDDDLASFGIAAAAPQRVGTVHARYALSGVRAVQAGLRRAIFLVVGVIGVVALALAALLVSGLVARLRALAAGATRVSGGDLDVVVDEHGDDEVAQLARDFNAMTRSLVVQRHTLSEQGAALAEREALAALGRATAVIAHELRNPLGIVLAAAELVKNETKPLAVRAEAAGLIEAEVRRLERTLGDLLAYARPRAPLCGDIDVAAVVDVVVARVTREGGPAAHVAVRVIVENADARHACADADLVEQIVWNLVQNAAQAGAVHVDVTVGVIVDSAGNDSVVIDVNDDGSGVADDVRALLFQPFSTTKTRGTGLGLSASRRLARDMGGELLLLCESSPTTTSTRAFSGATFRLQLPRRAQPTSRPSSAQGSP